MHTNPIIYNYSSRKTAISLNLSHACITRHVKRLIELKWCYRRDGHLCFVSPRKLAKTIDKKGRVTEHKLIAVKVYDNKQQQILELRKCVIWRNLDSQANIIKEKSETVKKAKSVYGKLSKASLRKINKAGGVANFENSIQHDINLSNRKFGTLIGRSKSTGYLLQKKLRDSGEIKTRSRNLILRPNCSLLEYKHYLNSVNYNCAIRYLNGNIVLQQANMVIMLKPVKANAIVGG